jgi:hypothetical protein
MAGPARRAAPRAKKETPHPTGTDKIHRTRFPIEFIRQRIRSYANPHVRAIGVCKVLPELTAK